jgi:hypothetical protein
MFLFNVGKDVGDDVNNDVGDVIHDNYLHWITTLNVQEFFV